MRRYSEKAKQLGECEMMGKPLGLNVKVGEKRGETGVTHESDRAQRSDLLDRRYRATHARRPKGAGRVSPSLPA
jgi:hypothetical protein